MLVKKFNINYAIIEHGWSPSVADLIKKLYYDPNWILIYYDEIAVIFIKNTPENKALISKFKIDFTMQESVKEFSFNS